MASRLPKRFPCWWWWVAASAFEDRSARTEDSEERSTWAAEFPKLLLNPIESRVCIHIPISTAIGLRIDRSPYILTANCHGFYRLRYTEKLGILR